MATSGDVYRHEIPWQRCASRHGDLVYSTVAINHEALPGELGRTPFRSTDIGGIVLKGYVQVYTGNGKGKTTAALGLTLRAAGAGLKVLIAQFIKKGEYSEVKSLMRLSDRVTVAQFGKGRLIMGQAPPECAELAKEGLECVKACIASGEYDIVILEEANVAVTKGVLSVRDLLDLIETKPDPVEIVITGRHADPRIIEKADLVTEMKPVKHYFNKGVKARIGIEK